MFSHVGAQIMREWLGTRLWRLDVLPMGAQIIREWLDTRLWRLDVSHMGAQIDNERMAGYETLETRCSPTWVHR